MARSLKEAGRVKTVTFRPHLDVRPDFNMLIDWCQLTDSNSSFNSVVNSFLPAIAYAVQNCILTDPETGQRYIRADFGDILLREDHNPKHANEPALED